MFYNTQSNICIDLASKAAASCSCPFYCDTLSLVYFIFQVIEWLPYSHANAIQLQHSKAETLADSDAKTSTVASMKVRKR